MKMTVSNFLSNTFFSASRNLGVIAVLLTVSIAAVGQREYTIAEIQGSDNLSPHNLKRVATSGIVTARTRNGFFIQTPDDKTDDDPATSEGLFVFTKTEPSADAALGNLVKVTGEVNEFRPASNPRTLTLTQLTMHANRDKVQIVSAGNQLPKPVTLTAADLKANTIDQLERYESMRMHIPALTVVSPTGGRIDTKLARAFSNGTFYGVLKGMPRPFREPGFDIYEWTFLTAREKERLRSEFPKIPLFDGNFERIRIDSSAQLGASAINTPAFAEITGLTGVVYYAFNAYTLFVDPDSQYEISGSFRSTPIPEPKANQFTIVASNLENLFDDENDPSMKEDVVEKVGFDRRLQKLSLAFRRSMHMPEVISVTEVENLSTLQRLGDRMNRDAVAEGLADPKYTAHLIEGNDGRGIDVGFLVRSSRVQVLEVIQLGKDITYTHPTNKSTIKLNDRPPLLLRASIENAEGKPFEFTVIVNHMKSYLGYNDPRQMDNVRMKKRLQAEFLANVVQERQTADPKERIFITGDLNSYQFNDGILDMVGIITGRPAAKDEVMNFSPAVVRPEMINLVDMIDARERYSYYYDGNAQVLDYIIVSANLKNNIDGYGFARVNANFPHTMFNDQTRPERFSDHDPAVVYVKF